MYKLTYFDTPGRGEPIRLIFSVAGVKFTDNRVKHADWPALKEQLGGGQLPLLEVGDKKLFQSKAIYRYLGRKFKMTGEDEWQAAKCDEIVDSVCEVVEEGIQIHFYEKDPAKKEERMSTFLKTLLPTLLGRLNKIQMENGGTWLIGKNMTWADIVTAEFLRQLGDVAGDVKLVEGYPHVRKLQEAVYSNPNVKAYRGK